MASAPVREDSYTMERYGTTLDGRPEGVSHDMAKMDGTTLDGRPDGDSYVCYGTTLDGRPEVSYDMAVYGTTLDGRPEASCGDGGTTLDGQPEHMTRQ